MSSSKPHPGSGASRRTSVCSHAGLPIEPTACLLDAEGRLYLVADIGLGLVHTQDVGLAAEVVEQGRWVPENVHAEDLPARFGIVPSPAAASRRARPDHEKSPQRAGFGSGLEALTCRRHRGERPPRRALRLRPPGRPVGHREGGTARIGHVDHRASNLEVVEVAAALGGHCALALQRVLDSVA